MHIAALRTMVSWTLWSIGTFMVLIAALILSVNSSKLASGVAYTKFWRWPQRKKSQGLRSGDRGGQVIAPPLPNPSIWMSRYTSPVLSYQNVEERHPFVATFASMLQGANLQAKLESFWKNCRKFSAFTLAGSAKGPTRLLSMPQPTN
jgi:hypothetical protein